MKNVSDIKTISPSSTLVKEKKLKEKKMKHFSNVIIYLGALIAGIILLSLKGTAGLLSGIVVAVGILILIPSIVMIFKALFPAKGADGTRPAPAWYVILVALVAAALGIWMIANPSFFLNITVYTLGAVLILVGLSGIVSVMQASREFHIRLMWWYLMPSLTIAGGLVLIFMGTSIIGTVADLTAGILLICFAVNGFSALGREGKEKRKEESDTGVIASDQD